MVHVSGRGFSCARNTTLLSRAEPQFYHRMLETGSDNWWSPRPHPPSRGGQCLAWFPGIEGRSVHLWSASPSPSTPVIIPYAPWHLQRSLSRLLASGHQWSPPSHPLDPHLSQLHPCSSEPRTTRRSLRTDFSTPDPRASARGGFSKRFCGLSVFLCFILK